MKQPNNNSKIKKSLMSFFWDTFCDQPLILVQNNKVEDLEKRLKTGALLPNYHYHQCSLLKHATSLVRPRVITLLLQWGADPNWPNHDDTEHNPRVCAIDAPYSHNRKALLKLLLTYGANYEHIRERAVEGREKIIWLDSIREECYELYGLLGLAHAQFAHAQCKLDFEQAAKNFENAKNLLDKFITEEHDERNLTDPEYQTDPAYLEDYILRHKEGNVPNLAEIR